MLIISSFPDAHGDDDGPMEHLLTNPRYLNDFRSVGKVGAARMPSALGPSRVVADARVALALYLVKHSRRKSEYYFKRLENSEMSAVNYSSKWRSCWP